MKTRRPWYHPLGLAKRIVISAVLVYVGICMFLYSIQNSLTYASKQSGAYLTTDQAISLSKSFGLVRWEHTTPGATVPQGYVRPDFINPAPRGTVVVFHGNGGSAFERTAYVDAFTRRGFRVFLYEYPGYGGRPGQPSEAAIVPDAQALVRSLDQAGFGPVYIWGESLGAGVAASVCSDSSLPVHGLVMMTPWDSIANLGAALYPWVPVRLLMIDRYNSAANLEHFQHPICVIRSELDEVIPASLTLNLIAHLPEPKKVMLQKDCGHNDWPSSPDLKWWAEALDFIAPK